MGRLVEVSQMTNGGQGISGTEKSMDKGPQGERTSEETEARVTGAGTPSSPGSNQASPLSPRSFSQRDSTGNGGAL